MSNSARLIFLVLCLLCIPALAQASPEQRYKQMLSASPEMRAADQSIHDTLDEARKLLSPQDYAEIEKIQVSWVKNELAGNIKAYMETGLSESEAWAQEIGSHADSLSRAVEVLDLRRKGKGVEGVYEYRKEGKAQRQGIMLVRQVETSYTVEIMVSTGAPTESTPPCTFSGEGPLQQGSITAATEESDATVTAAFKGNTATVRANAAAEAQCEKGFSLAGQYKK